MKIKLLSNNYLIFSGYRWYIKEAYNKKENPGPNYFINDNQSIWIDDNGYLHLKIRKINGIWYCTEIFSEQSFGFGIYSFEITSEFENLDVNVVVGLSLSFDNEKIFAIEFSHWGIKNKKNAQYVIRSFNSEVSSQFNFELNKKSIHNFQLCNDYIKFWSYYPSDISSKSSNKFIHEWNYFWYDNLNFNKGSVHLNIWLFNGNPPTDESEAEIVIEKFKFKSSECVNSFIIFLSYYWNFILIIALTYILMIILPFLKAHKKIIATFKDRNNPN
ncbi:MAG: hypothetical protein ACTSRP_14885 [Candidatus Helarchaeota archaeon]